MRNKRKLDWKLLKAISRDQSVAEIYRLIEQGAEVNVVIGTHYHFSIERKLSNFFIPVSKQIVLQNATLLHIAAISLCGDKQYQVLSALLDSGANPQVLAIYHRPSSGETKQVLPIDLATDRRVKVLLGEGSGAQNEFGQSGLSCSVS